MSVWDRSAKRDKKREIAMAQLDCISEGILTTTREWGFAECPCPKKCTLHANACCVPPTKAASTACPAVSVRPERS